MKPVHFILYAVVSLLLGMAPGRAVAQNYIEYQKVFNRADEDILAGNLHNALERMDSIYQQYSFIHAKHCVKALQVCTMLNDSVTANKWLEKALLRGVPLWVLRTDSISNKSLNYTTTQRTLANHDSLYKVYRSSIDTVLAKQVEELITRDARLTNRVNNGFWMLAGTIYALQWIHNNQKEFKILRDIMLTKGYPAEKIVGLVDVEETPGHLAFMKRGGVGLFLEERNTLIMLLHYYTTRHKGINDILLKAVENGELPPNQFARIADYTAYRNKKGKYPSYYIHTKLSSDVPVEDVNKLRAGIGLNTIEQQRRNERIQWEEMKAYKLGVILE